MSKTCPRWGSKSKDDLSFEVAVVKLSEFIRRLLIFILIQQLSPTIQGSEASHESGLEQTLFDRLIKMVKLCLIYPLGCSVSKVVGSILASNS